VANRHLTVALVALLIGGCVAAPAPSVAPPTPTATSQSPSAASPTTSPATPTPVATTPVSCAAQTLASLTEPQRIGQLFMLGLTNNRLDASERAAIAQLHFGSMWFTAKTSAGVAAVRSVADAVQAQATRAATGRVGFFVAANQEGGQIQALSGPGFDVIPSALSQGTLAPAVLETRAARWGRQLRAAGVNMNFAPVADVVPPGTDSQNAPIGRLKREFGHDPATVSSHVAAFIAGMKQAGIATSVKHFPGLGRVRGNTDFTGDVRDSVTTRDDPYLAPFARAIQGGVPFVMVSLATYERIDTAHLAVFSPTVMRGMLRDDLSYDGVVISDDMGVAVGVESISPATRAIDFLNAGGDMIISKGLAPAQEMARGLASRAATNTSFGERVDDAALRILQAKEAASLLPC
jgi:beta-N-acetylhexosaminidase